MAAAGAAYIVDAMSSFGAIPLDLERARIDFLISPPPISASREFPDSALFWPRRAALEASKRRARTLSLDLHAQWAGLENDGQFRFTPPTHVLLAFRQALRELEEEGGIGARAERYSRNHARLVRGMTDLGFETYLDAADQSYIITSFRYPADSAFQFERFYAQLSELGFVIYPGKLSHEPCFRIGTIGRISEADIDRLLGAVEQVISASRVE